MDNTNEYILERYELCKDKLLDIKGEDEIKEPLLSYFISVSEFLIKLSTILDRSLSGGIESVQLKELELENHEIYSDILPEHYEYSYANPDYITRVFEEIKDKYSDADDAAKLLCFVYTEMRGLIPAAYEGNVCIFTTYVELFLEIFTMFRMAGADGEYPKADSIREAVYWFESDNCDVVVPDKMHRQIDPEYSFARNIIMNSDLNNIRYLYSYGEYVTEDEIETARFLNTLSEDEIKLMADTFTEGYRVGFVKAGKPLDKKISVNVRFSLGFERVTRQAILNFREMGLESVIYRAATLSLDKRGLRKIGYVGANPNRQYDFDHKDDEALYIDADFVTRKIEVLKESFENLKKEANGHAGPACQEVFGEAPFEPTSKKTAVIHNDKTRDLSVSYESKASEITNEYIIGEERSFTIIAYPVPSIGEDYVDIFKETIKLNTLDYKLYEGIQQKLIDALDKADKVHVVGKGNNRTDLYISLYPIDNPDKETKFENCVADVNIPVGEVFTSPILKGTEGVLHVTSVYLNELKYIDFELHIKDGVITDYNCANFEREDDNKKYIRDNFLFNHKTLPMGEFAIGTNTIAYKMTRDYGIEDKLPILIGEKTGPHFAFGDTCYSHEEDVPCYNPDGKEIIARENDYSKLRSVDMKKAYFQCHTDVTIPYDELGSITAIGSGMEVKLFDGGIFVLEGCEELNKPLKD